MSDTRAFAFFTSGSSRTAFSITAKVSEFRGALLGDASFSSLRSFSIDSIFFTRSST